MIIFYCVADTRNLILNSLEVFEIEFLLYAIGVFIFTMIYLILMKLVELSKLHFNTKSLLWIIIWGIVLFLIPMIISIILVRYFQLTLDKLKALMKMLMEMLGPLLAILALLALLALLGLGALLGILWDLLKNLLLGLLGALALTILFALLMALLGLLSAFLLFALLAWAKIAMSGGFRSMAQKMGPKITPKPAPVVNKKTKTHKHGEEDDDDEPEDDQEGI